MNVFLTGGTGYIGRPLAKCLLQRGWNVTALVRKPESAKAQALQELGMRLVRGDITERESMREPMMGVDLIIHNAGQYEFGLDRAGKERMRRINVDGTENVLSLAYELGIPRTVHVSTTYAIGETGQTQRDETYVRQYPCNSTYEQTKTEAHLAAEKYIQRGLPLVITCPNGVIGANDQSFFGYLIRLYINHVLPPLRWSKKKIASLVALEDLAEGIALTSEKGRTGETYLLCGEALSIQEHFAFWEKMPGGLGAWCWLPPGIAAALTAPLEPVQRISGLPAFFSRETVKGTFINMNYSSEKAKRELGWSYRPAEKMWLEALKGEIDLLARRKGQSLVERLKPLDVC